LPQPDTTDASDKILTGSHAAKRLGIPLSTLRNLVRYGTLRATSIENTEVGLKESEIQRFLDQFTESAPIELADPKSIEGSLRTEPPARSPRSRVNNTVYTAPAGQLKKKALRCRCGSCPTCQDGARWERIFQEKFADPDYYTRRVQRDGSSLSRLS
jgi:excisionase family DNA binding protein